MTLDVVAPIVVVVDRRQQMDGIEVRSTHPDSPWLCRPDWAEGSIRTRTGSRATMLWAMAVPWNGFVWAVLWALRDDPDKAEMVKVAALFALLGIVLLGAAVSAALAWFRFGSSVLRLATIPGVLGGTIAGRIETRLARRPSGPVQLTLSCVRRRVSRREVRSGRTGGATADIRSDSLWQGGCLVPPELLEEGPGGLAIPVKLLVPYGLPDSDGSDPSNEIVWTLTAAADIPGVDFSAEFPVPVFVTAASDPGLTAAAVEELAESEHGTAFTQPVNRKQSWTPPVVVQPTAGGGVGYTFRLAVTLKVALAVTGLALAVSGASAALFVWLGRAGPFALVPGAVGALLLLATAVIWTFASRVEVAPGAITIRKSVLGIPRRWTVAASEVEEIRVGREGEDWEIRIVRRLGPELNLGATIPGRDDAKRVAAEIERVLRSRDRSTPADSADRSARFRAPRSLRWMRSTLENETEEHEP